MEAFFDAKLRQTPAHFEGMVNESIEGTFIDALECALADVDDNKKT